MNKLINAFNEFCGDSDDTILDEFLQLVTIITIVFTMVVISTWL